MPPADPTGAQGSTRPDLGPKAMDWGVVVIGRNEGERLRRCLESVLKQTDRVVYVDSGSTDGSVALARRLGARVVRLDLSQAFTAGRARNAGWHALLRQWPHLGWVQFVDGDCEVMAGWLAAARAFMGQHTQHAVVCGRVRERHPEASIYNRLCDQEWDTPVGDTRACGGNAFMRVEALLAVQGFRDGLIAGEEPELCVRLRAQGWKVHRLDVDMTWHEAAMGHWHQWWRRTVRGGYAFAEGAWLHGAPPERHWVAETRRALLWGGLLPAVLLALAVGLGPECLALCLVYPLQWLRLAWRTGSRARASFLVLGKFAEAQGCLKFYWGLWTRRRSGLIEYK